jgi:NAD(P)-dependent dehydrogenase (short-subunit alcohol dehydrogenase family)
MTGSLAGRTGLVTGAARGIGLAIARRLTEAGARVVMTDVDERTLEESASEVPGSVVFRLDVSDPRAVERVVAEATSTLGPLDILVNNAGIAGGPNPSPSRATGTGRP